MQTGTKTKLEPEVITTELRPQQRRSGRWIGSLWLLWDHRRLLWRAAIVGLVVGVATAFLLPTRYQATAQLMPPDSQANPAMTMLASLSMKSGGILGPLGADMLGIKNSGALFVGMLRSRKVENRIVDRFDLKREYSIRYDEDACEKLAENTVISEDRKSGIITLAVTDGDRVRAAAMAQAYIEELDRLVAEVSTSAAHRERMFLEERLKEVKQDLDQASREFSQFASRNVAIDIKEQSKAMVEAAAILQGQLIAAESELRGLETIYTGNNVRVRTLRARVNELRQQLTNIGGTDESDGAAASSSAGSSDNQALPYPTIRKLPLLGVTYADLYRRTRIQEVVFETLTQQYELAKVQEAKETPSVKLLDSPRIPQKRSFPPRAAITVLGVFFALVGCSIWVLGRSRWEQTDSDAAGKLLATEVARSVRTRLAWASPNGRMHAFASKIWKRAERQETQEINAENATESDIESNGESR